MAWDQIEVTRPHVAYATTGFALLLFGTLSLFIKEKLYIGEATVSTVYGLIVGPHALNWFSPTTWGNSDYITLELSRIVLVVQIFAVAVELPKKYMLKHWLSVFILLIPVMTYGWLIGSVFIWKLVPTLRWIEALAIAGCVTATDPVLASAVVGKGKFAKRVPGHLRNILSAESACNDGMAFPFVFMALNIISHEHHAKDIAVHFICISVLYECVLGTIMGAVIGYAGRHLIKFSERMNLIDRESFLAYYFCMALFCAGVGTVTGVDDLLVAFAAGTAFSWDGWFSKKTEKSEVSNVIDLLINSAYFIYFGAIIPWEKFNDHDLGIKAWKLVILAILVLLVRRIPIMLALKPVIPDIKTWREALFCGHFGPIGVGGLFMAILARAYLENDSVTPLKDLPRKDHPYYYLIATIWPITCFLVLSSIIVHGSSIALFALGKRLNNMTITMSYTTGGNGPTWLSRLPDRMKSDFNKGDGNILSFEKVDTNLRPRKNSSSAAGRASGAQHVGAARRSRAKRDDSKIPVALSLDLKEKGTNKVDHVYQTGTISREDFPDGDPRDLTGYQEGSRLVFEDHDGKVVKQFDLPVSGHEATITGTPKLNIDMHEEEPQRAEEDSSSEGRAQTVVDGSVSNSPVADSEEDGKEVVTSRRSSDETDRRTAASVRGGRTLSLSAVPTAPLNLPERGGQVFAYQLDDHVLVENADGEIIRRYKVHRRGDAPASASGESFFKRLGRMFGKGNKDDGDLEHTPRDTLERIPTTVREKDNLTYNEDQEIQHRLENMLDNGELQTSRVADDHIRHVSADAAVEKLHKLERDAEHLPSKASHVVSEHLGKLLNPDMPHGRSHDSSPSEGGSTTPVVPRPSQPLPSQSGTFEISDDDIPYQGPADAEEEETAVERNRRLAALGVLGNDEEDSDDDIAPVPTRTPDRRINPIIEEADEPRITFNLPASHRK